MPTDPARADSMRAALFDLRVAMKEAGDREKAPAAIRRAHDIVSDLTEDLGTFRLDRREKGLVLDQDEETLELLNPVLAIELSERMVGMEIRAVRFDPPVEMRASGAFFLGLSRRTPAPAIASKLPDDGGVSLLLEDGETWIGEPVEETGDPDDANGSGEGDPSDDPDEAGTEEAPHDGSPAGPSDEDPFDTGRFERSSTGELKSGAFRVDGAVTTAMTSFEALLSDLEEIEDQGLRRTIKGDLMRQIHSSEPGIPFEGGGGLDEATAEELARALGEVRAWLVTLGLAPASLSEGLELLRGVWNPVATLVQDDPALLQRLGDLLGVDDVEVETEREGVERALDIAKLDGVQLVRELETTEPEAVAGLLRDHAEEQALVDLVEGLGAALSLPFPEVRERVPRLLCGVVRAIVDSRLRIGLLAAENALRQLVGKAEGKETAELARLLAEAAIHRIGSGKLERAVSGIAAIDRLRGEAEDGPAAEQLDRVADEAGEGVVSSLLADDREQRAAAEKILAFLGERLAEPLCKELAITEDPGDQERLGHMVGEMGRTGVESVLDALLESSQWGDEARVDRLARALEGTSERRLVLQRLGPLITDPIPSRRHLAVDVLSSIGGDLAGQVLLDGLDAATDPGTVLRILRALTRVGPPEALSRLKRLVEEEAVREDEALGTAVAQCLTAVGGSEAVRLLASLTPPGSRLSLRSSAWPLAVRRQATHGLARHRSDPAASEALKELRDDADAEIRKLARSAIEGLKETFDSDVLDVIDQAPDDVDETSLAIKLGRVDLDQSGFAGRLEDMPIDQVLQMLETVEKTGLLRLSLGDRFARIYFDGGRIVHATFAGEAGEEAIYAIVGEAEGHYMFEDGAEPDERTMASPVQPVLMEAYRLMDQAATEAAEPEG